MKIAQTPPEFTPITITLESPAEVAALQRLVGLTSDRYSKRFGLEDGTLQSLFDVLDEAPGVNHDDFPSVEGTLEVTPVNSLEVGD